MPALARADLEHLLRARKLDVTLTTSVPLAGEESGVAPSGVDSLDAWLRGGWPRGQLSEVTGPRSSGRTLLATQTLAAATRRGELAALVDTLDTFDPASAAGTGIAWPLLLWIRGTPLAATRVRDGSIGMRADHELLERAVDRAIKAASIVLASGSVGLLVVDLAGVPVQVLRRLPFTTWLRVQRLIEGGDTVCLLVASEPLGRSAGGVSLALVPSRPIGRWRGEHDRARLLAGLAPRAHIVRARGIVEADRELALEVGTG
jgi:hypothetical protein